MNAALLRSCSRVSSGLAALLLALGICAAPSVAPAQANLVDQVLSRCGDRPYSYDQMVSYLSQLDGTGRVSVVPIGKSGGGRMIPLVAVYYPGTVFGQTMRLFIIARQHGTECAGTEAALALINHFAQSSAPDDLMLLRRLTFVFVPMANPDGVCEGQRCNNADVDLNRDWIGRTQPETQALDWAFRVWQPHAVFDCHELPAESSREAYQENFLETIADDPALNTVMTDWCSYISLNIRKYEVAYGLRLNTYYDDHSTDRSLSHRHFGLDYQVPSFLLESKTGAGRSLQERIRFHVIAILVAANLLAQQAPGTTIAPPQQVASRPPVISIPYSPPTPPARRATTPAETMVTIASPAADQQTFSDRIALRVQVKPSTEFAYLSVRVDGVLRSLSDLIPYETNLTLDAFQNGAHTITCQAHDGGGRVLAEAKRVVVVDKNVAGR